MALTPSDDCIPLDIETANQHASRSRKPKLYAISISFMLGMMVATMGLLTVQHYGLGDASFTKFFFAPVIHNVRPEPAGSVRPVGARVSSSQSDDLGGASFASIHQPIPSSRSEQMPISFAAVSPLPLVHSIKASADMEESSRTNEPLSYRNTNEVVAAAEAKGLPWSFNTLWSLPQPFRLLMIVIGALSFLWLRQQSGSVGIMGGRASPMCMMIPSPDGPEQTQTEPGRSAAHVPTRSGTPAMYMGSTAVKVVDRLVSLGSHTLAFMRINHFFAFQNYAWVGLGGLNSRWTLKTIFAKYVNLIHFCVKKYSLYSFFPGPFASAIAILLVNWRRVPFSRHARFCTTQALLMDLSVSCCATLFSRASWVGIADTNCLYLGTLMLIAYSFVLTACGQYPKIPGLTSVSKLLNRNEEKNEELPRSLRDFDLKPQHVAEYLNRSVIQQDHAKQALAVSVCNHFNHVRRQLSAPDEAQKDFTKPNILLVGPTGVGKTYLMEKIAGLIGVPFVKADATKFTPTGYGGRNFEDLVRDLVRAADGNKKLAQFGIIYLDEIDKLCGEHADKNGSYNLQTQGDLLKLLEDTDVNLYSVFDLFQGFKDESTISTRNILFIFSGAFVSLDREIKRQKETSSFGFVDVAQEERKSTSYLRYAETKHFVSAGLTPELVGRIPVRVALEALTADNLKEILTRSEGSVVKQYIAAFKDFGIDMKAIDDDALTEVAKLAEKEGTGARGLVTVLERILRKHNFDLPSSSIKEFELDLATVRSPTDGLTTLLKSMTEEDKKKARLDDLKMWEKRLKQEVAPLELSITDEAMDFLLQLSSERDEGAYWFAMHRFEGLSAWLKKNAGTKFCIDLAWVQDPENQAEHCKSAVE